VYENPTFLTFFSAVGDAKCHITLRNGVPANETYKFHFIRSWIFFWIDASIHKNFSWASPSCLAFLKFWISSNVAGMADCNVGQIEKQSNLNNYSLLISAHVCWITFLVFLSELLSIYLNVKGSSNLTDVVDIFFVSAINYFSLRRVDVLHF